MKVLNFEVNIVEEFIVGTPEIIFSELEEEYFTNTDIEATATVVSNGYIDALCGINYQVYKDGEALEGDISEYGSLKYSFRDAGSDMYVGNLTEASGNLSIEVGEENVGAFSLGIFDTYCVNRNRNISFTANFTQPGLYKVEANLNSCSNTGDILEIGGFTANEICGGAYHNDLVAETCENPEVIESFEFEVNIVEEFIVGTPEIIFSELEEEYFTNTDIEATATVVSNGYIDALCGIDYQIYKDGIALEGDISEYGSLTYSFRDAGSDMYVGNLTEASGNLSIEVGEENVGAFSLGIFDTYCVNRNRDISFTVNFTQPGLYKVEANLNSCSNTGDILEIGGFTANEICGGAYHNDLVAETCENPEVIESFEFEVNIVEEFIVGTPEIIFSELEEEYFTNTDIEATATVVSNGYIDALCGIDYQIYKDGIALEGDISEYGSLTYSFRDAGSDMYVGNLTEASGNLSIEVGEENVGAFSLGIFDTYCVNRNRDISFTVNFIQAGIYKVEANLNSCSNTGDILEIGGFTANEICGGAYHNDLVAETCENPEVIESYNFEVKIIEYPVFTFIVNEIEYNDGDVIEVCYNSELEIELDYTPGSNIEFASESNIILSTTNDDPSESGNIFATLTVDESISENLTITISNSLTSYTTTYTLVVNALPIVDLGEDAIYCADESVVLEAPEAEYYLWSNDATTQSISITETGTYSVTITDANGCAGSDEIEITINPLPIVDLGEDISVEENQIFVLSVDETYAEYLWSTGETTNSIEVYGEVLGLGTHTISVTVTDFNTCTGSDQITITVTPTVEVLNGYVNTYTVYPNPTSGIINITGDNIISCVIFNNIGQIILETNNSEIDMSNYENGIYYVKILTDNDTKTIKFVKH
ncbi:MAG: T9SS type A sorting domain-containing protein [Bacteroidales bacterium]